MNINYLHRLAVGTLTSLFISGFPLFVGAEVTPADLSETDSSQISDQLVNDQPSTVISGGVRSGDNLFHFFEDFNVLTGEKVFYLNDVNASRIFSLTTGSNSSDIDGTLGVIGDGDLFFLNSNGINFGPNAALDIQGSFIGTTANRIDFADGTSLSPVTADGTPLLSSSVPIGLGLSGQVSAITVENTGHTLAGSGLLPYVEALPESGLDVNPSHTLSIIGGSISMDGGIIRTPDGLAAVGAVENGTAILEPSSLGWQIDYSDSSILGKIELSDAALIDARGIRGGAVQVTGEDVSLLDRSVVTSTGTIGTPTGTIEVAAGRLYIDGESTTQFIYNPNASPLIPLQIVPASIISQSLGTSKGSNITIQAEQVILQNGGGITARAFELGSPGNIDISANSIVLTGNQPDFEILFSSINTLSLGPTQNSGSIRIDTDALMLRDGALIASSSFGRGQAGKIAIDAEDVVVNGVATSTTQFPSSILSSAFIVGALDTETTGNGSDVEINTARLQVSNGGLVLSKAAGTGNTGSVIVNATEQVEVFSSRQNSSSRLGSSIGIDSEIANPLGFAESSSGNTGSVLISTPSLIVREGGSISVENAGTGDSGRLSIAADSIQQLSAGRISAFTAGGEGGDIDIDSDSLLLTGFSSIDSSSLGLGNGGNIFIESDVIALLDSTTLSANASQGGGGQVLISVNALVRSQNSSITATSDAGPELDGVVEIQGQEDTSQQASEIDMPVEMPSLAFSCINQGEGFIVTGRGGTSVSQGSTARYWNGWNAQADISSTTPQSNQIVEARGWTHDENGNVRLVSIGLNTSSSIGNPSTDCTNSPSQSSPS